MPSPAKKAAAPAKPEPSGLVGTVVGAHAVNGVAPGGEIVVASLDFARYLHNAGHVRFAHPDGAAMNDGDLVALQEAGF